MASKVLQRSRHLDPTVQGRMHLSVSLMILFLLLLGPARPCLPGASERLLDFTSRIQVHPDGSMTVEETIQVASQGEQIKRGIFREFPTRYKDRYGNTVNVGFQIINILRDGRQEPYHVKEAPNGKRIYIGQKDVFLKPGHYTYNITYRTDRQLGFFEDFDELYWNVTGNGWNFVIDRARAVVKLPPGAKIQDKAAYTGRSGEKGRDFTIGFAEDGGLTFTTTRPLMPEEGLTIAVAWPKGFVEEPTGRDKANFVLQDNRSVVWGLAGMSILFAYYMLAWVRVGRDPEKGTIIPRFFPPKGFSPAAVRFVMRMGFDDKSFAAAVVNLAVKGSVIINQAGGREFSLDKTGNDKSALSKGERSVMEKLFSSTTERIKLQKTNHREIRGAISALQKSLRRDFEKIYFLKNSGHFVVGQVLTLLSIGAVILTAHNLPVAAFMGLWLSIWTAGCFVMVVSTVRAWKSALQGESKILLGFGAVAKTLFALPFLGGEVFGLFAFASSVSPFAAIVLVGLVFINVLFYYLLKAPTLSGRRIMDEIEGFKLYLSVAEEDRLNMLNPPDKTPELFERYLPYAMALNVENEWSDKFSQVLAAAAAGEGYRPVWYTGTSFRPMDGRTLASSLGSAFPGAISSASTAPGSSSGIGGGGSSGGGGGGGGGGGW